MYRLHSRRTGHITVQVWGRQKTQKPQADEEVSIQVETSTPKVVTLEIDMTVIQLLTI